MLNFDISIIITIIFSLIVLYLLFRVLVYPLRFIFRVLLQTAGGLIILLIFNFFISYWGFSVGVNLLTGLVVGIMGIPGLVMLICLQMIT